MAERTCSIDGCSNRTVAHGLCGTHYDKARKYGDPLHVPPRLETMALAERLYGPILPTAVCQVEGCGRLKVRRRGKPTGRWCTGHLGRWSARRDVGEADMRAPDGSGYVRRNGYRVLGWITHPLADTTGQVYEHRAVAYEHYGPGAQTCHWCGLPLASWREVHIDHLDADRLNNKPENLVTACASCNTARANQGNPLDWTPPHAVREGASG